MVEKKRIFGRVSVAKWIAAAFMLALALVVAPAIQTVITPTFAEATSLTGVYKAKDGNWYYYVNGVVQKVDTVAKNDYGWWVIRNGKVDFSYTGFAHNSNGWWWCENGKVNFNKNSVVKDTKSVVDGTQSWWYVVNGKIRRMTTVAKNEYGWWYINGALGGKVDFSYTGIGKNDNGWWWCDNGQVNFDKNDVVKCTVSGYGKAWWHIKSGKVTFDYTVAKNSNGWWAIQGGKVNFNYNGIAANENGAWKISGGKVDFDYNGTVTQNGSSLSPSEGYYFHVSGGKVDGITFKSSLSGIGTTLSIYNSDITKMNKVIKTNVGIDGLAYKLIGSYVGHGGEVSFVNGQYFSIGDSSTAAACEQGYVNAITYLGLRYTSECSCRCTVYTHELAHWADLLIGNGDYASNGTTFATIYNKYKGSFSRSDGCTHGRDSAQEMYADAVAEYVSNASRLKSKYPDLYNYVVNSISQAVAAL